MKKIFMAVLLTAALVFCTAACGSKTNPAEPSKTAAQTSEEVGAVTRTTKVQDVIDDPVFADYGRLMFPVDQTIRDSLTLENTGDILTWYNYINPDKTVEIVNYLREQALSGNQIFYDIYTEEEKELDPWKADTGLFFFRGEPNGKTAETVVPLETASGCHTLNGTNS